MQISHNSQEPLQEKPPPYPHPLEAFYQDVQEQFSILHGLQTWGRAEIAKRQRIKKKKKERK